jgi:hypothetical protein
MATLTPVEGNPFEGVAKPSTQVMTNEDFGIAKLPVPTSETPEYLGAKVSLPESFKMFMGTMATTDPRALQDIILSSVEGSQGGEDEKGNHSIQTNKAYLLLMQSVLWAILFNLYLLPNLLVLLKVQLLDLVLLE